jgi:predicted O-methyltransferase YrrM
MLISDEIAKLDVNSRAHVAGAFSTAVLRRIEQLLPTNIQYSVETGCGKSTILFSNLSQDHTVFCLEDREHGDNSSINFFETCALTKNERVKMVLGATQKTLPFYNEFKKYDVVLIDGPHGFPFPEMEYYHFYPHLRTGGILIIDDVHIPTIGRFADILAEDAMFEPVELVSTTAVFRRTDAPTFDPTGDGWWIQNYNRRRIPRFIPYLKDFVLDDDNILPSFSEQFRTDIPAIGGEHFLVTKARKLFGRS